MSLMSSKQCKLYDAICIDYLYTALNSWWCEQGQWMIIFQADPCTLGAISGKSVKRCQIYLFSLSAGFCVLKEYMIYISEIIKEARK